MPEKGRILEGFKGKEEGRREEMIRTVRGWFLYTQDHNEGCIKENICWGEIPKTATNQKREFTGPRFT